MAASRCAGLVAPTIGATMAGRERSHASATSAGVTPRAVITALAEAVEELGLPHRVHLHANNLGNALGFATMAETMDTYGHLFPDAEDYGRGALDRLIGGGACSPVVPRPAAPWAKGQARR